MNEGLVKAFGGIGTNGMDIYQEFLAITKRLQDLAIDFAVCGGFAMAIHGHPRATKDIDLLILAEDVPRVIEAVNDLGFNLDSGPIPLPFPFPREIRRITKTQGEEFITLDLLLVAPVYQEIWETRSWYEWNGHQLSTVTAAGLAKMKRLVGRHQDLADIENLGFSTDDPTLQS